MTTTELKTYNSLLTKYEKVFGYKPTENELINLYQQGELSLNDKQENVLLKYFIN